MEYKLLAICSFSFLLVSCDTRGMFTDQRPNKALRDAAAAELGGVEEALKTHYWSGHEWVEGPYPSYRAAKAAKKLGLGSEKEARKTHVWNYTDWVPKDKTTK